MSWFLWFCRTCIYEACKLNEKCDVYSFGVVTLEVIMGKHPGDLISLLSSSSSSSSATTSTAHGILLKDVLDQRLEPPRNRVARIVVSIAKLAFACLETNPQSRPAMQQISRELSIERSPLSEMFDKITLGQLLVWSCSREFHTFFFIFYFLFYCTALGWVMQIRILFVWIKFII